MRISDITLLQNTHARNKKVRARVAYYQGIKDPESGIPKMSYVWILDKVAREFTCSVKTIERALGSSDQEELEEINAKKKLMGAIF